MSGVHAMCNAHDIWMTIPRHAIEQGPIISYDLVYMHSSALFGKVCLTVRRSECHMLYAGS